MSGTLLISGEYTKELPMAPDLKSDASSSISTPSNDTGSNGSTSFLSRLKGFRTLLSSALFTVAGGLLMFYDQLQAAGVDIKALISDHVPTKYVGLVVVGISVAFAWLRIITTTPVGTK